MDTLWNLKKKKPFVTTTCPLQKLHVFLFELVLVLTRPVVQDKEGMVQFQVYRQPLPASQILLEDLPDGEGSSSGSFRGAFTGNDKGKLYCMFFDIMQESQKAAV